MKKRDNSYKVLYTNRFNELSRMVYELLPIKLSIKRYSIYGDKNM